MPGTGAGSSSSDAGEPQPGETCGPRGYTIQFAASEPDCGQLVKDVVLPTQCVVITEWGGGRLQGSFATGCVEDACVATSDRQFELSVEDLDLRIPFEDPDSNEARCAWIKLVGSPDGNGNCDYRRLEIWEASGLLRFGLGHGPPDDFPQLDRPVDGPIPIFSSFYEETSCGEMAMCDRAGFRSLLAGVGGPPALPDGIPVETTFPGVANGDFLLHSVFNWGLQYDLGCRGWGQWAIIPFGTEDVFD